MSCFSQFLVGNYSEYINSKTVFTSLNFYSFEKIMGIRKKMFKFYLYGYLNDYHAQKPYLSFNDDLSYKKFKLDKVISYLKLPSKYSKLFKRFEWLISMFETFFSVLILSFTFIKYSFINMVTLSKKITNTNLLLGYNSDKKFFTNMMNSIDVVKEDITILEIPSNKTKYFDYKRTSMFTGIDFKDILKSYYYSFKMIFLIKKKYNKRDFLFRAYSSFEYFLCFIYIKKNDKSNKYYFDALYDRWAYLFGDIPHETHFIQHGVINDKVKFKRIGKVNYAYYINEKQKNICEKILFKNIPVAFYRKNTNLGGVSKLLNNGKKNILLICNIAFFDKEKEIIKDLSNININLYVKPHPTNSHHPYENLMLLNNFILLQKNDLPKVDFVISYFSTLAIEYESIGVEVLMYDDELFQYKLDNLININL